MSALSTAAGVAGAVILLGVAMNGGPAKNPDGSVDLGGTLEQGAHTGVKTAGDTAAQGAKGAVDGALDSDLAKAGLVIAGGYTVGRVGVAVAGNARNNGGDEPEAEEPSGEWVCDSLEEAESTPCAVSDDGDVVEDSELDGDEGELVDAGDTMSAHIPEIGEPPVLVFD